MATLTVTASHDYRNETLSNITTIEFREPGQFDSALVTFSPLQFDDVQISSKGPEQNLHPR